MLQCENATHNTPTGVNDKTGPAADALSVNQGPEGCGTGYWKNHIAMWDSTVYDTAQRCAAVFPTAAGYPDVAASTLLEALRFRGGSGLEEKVQLLMRAAVTELLNALHPGVEFPLAIEEITEQRDRSCRSRQAHGHAASRTVQRIEQGRLSPVTVS